MTDILMPQLSDSMEQGTIITWLKSTGDHVNVGDELLEIETDKSTVSYTAETAGTIEILIEVGTTVAVGQPIARIVNAISEPPRPDRAASIGAAQPVDQPSEDGPTNGQLKGAERRHPRATPLARRIAAAHGIALHDVQGSGPLGRITRVDVLRSAGLAITDPPRPSPPTAPPIPTARDQASALGPASITPGTRRQELTRLQRLIATRMADAKTTIPHFQVQTEVDMTAAIALRGELRGLAGDEQPVPSFNDLVVKAAALALREHPLANGSYKDGGFELHDAVNIGVAVAADDALIVPTVFSADSKPLGDIASETRRLATRCRDGTIAPAELSGGTFTVSNLGMFGMTVITPVINPPQAAILGVGAIRYTLARANGEIIDLPLLTLTLSCDHRILYGADAARFLARIQELLHSPLKLAL